MSVFFADGSQDRELPVRDLQEGLFQALQKLGSRRRVLAVPPDFTRYHSFAGDLTRHTRQYYGANLTAVLPALGTHAPMSSGGMEMMFGDLPRELFCTHDWRNAIVTLDEVAADFVRQQSEGRLTYSWPTQVNRLLVEGGFDLILSIGQVVPHEVSGIANYNKNILVGTGGQEGINRSHFLGAVYGMERIMGRPSNPVRCVLNYASDHFLRELPIVYVLTVVSRNDLGQPVARGIFVGDDLECFESAAELSLKVNFQMLDRQIRKVIVFLDAGEYKITWLGNKAVYRTRMAIADTGELIVLAPGVKEFGEDAAINRLIRQYGYRDTPATLPAVDKNADLAANLSAAGHLIHGSSQGRFTITYCPGHLSKEEVESVGYRYGYLEHIMEKYSPPKLREGFNEVDGEEVFFVQNPGLGLWAHPDRL